MKRVLLAILLVACGDQEGEREIQCRAMADSVCHHLAECYEDGDYLACYAGRRADCEQRTSVTPEAVHECALAFPDLSCDQVHAHVVPSACMP